MRALKLLLAAAMILPATSAVAAKGDAQARAEAKLAKALEGRVAGEPVNCIDLRNINSSQIIDKTAIIYRVGSRLYLNRPTIGASSLDSDDILVTKTYSSQLCSIDTVQLVDRASRFPSGFVGLGKFVPYTRVKG